jgi:Uma2 family endonuclease
MTATFTQPRRSTPESKPVLPPLESGDHLTAAEFERRWDAMPHIKRAELIQGVVYVAAALRHREHGEPHTRMTLWLGHYLYRTPGLELGDASSLRVDADNVPQPDLLLRIPERAGGQSRVTEDGYLEGPPELIAEIAASSTSIDLHDKLHVYRRAGVLEYIVWRVLDEAVDWFVLHEGTYQPLPPDTDGFVKSRVYPGLWLDPAALLRGDLAKLFEVVDAGVKTSDRAALLARLAPTGPPLQPRD